MVRNGRCPQLLPSAVRPGLGAGRRRRLQQDPITAQGISDAFIDAEHLTAALDDGWSSRRPLDDALANHQSRRDERVKPLYDFTCQLAALEPPPPHMQQLFAAVRGNQEATNQFYSAITGSSPLPAFMNPANLNRIMTSAGARR